MNILGNDTSDSNSVRISTCHKTFVFIIYEIHLTHETFFHYLSCHCCYFKKTKMNPEHSEQNGKRFFYFMRAFYLFYNLRKYFDRGVTGKMKIVKLQKFIKTTLQRTKYILILEQIAKAIRFFLRCKSF